MGLVDFFKRQTVKSRITNSGDGLRIGGFVDLPHTPGNVGVCHATQINLLASLSAWVVAGEKNAGLILDMYQSSS